MANWHGVRSRSLWPRLVWEEQRCYRNLHMNMDTALWGQARRLGLPYNDFCRSCHNEEEEDCVTSPGELSGVGGSPVGVSSRKGSSIVVYGLGNLTAFVRAAVN
ncbi:hypothetical protein EVAR_72293_1 [Eumeta japonica]|uniref:Uncharacterized protein n=1 Tax=Eumeta variegata TaxID=151549 RepID=A0A4C1T753_EUMVA|nr:hypothetical protein EVAR_72293_1 [Eumeta japonica]